MPNASLYTGDARDTLASLSAESVQTCVTSPPYWGLRDYGEDGQLGLEETPEGYVQKLVGVFREVRRVLRDDGTVWLNIGDTYAGGGGVAGKPDDWDDMHNDGNYPDSTPARSVKGLKDKDLSMIPSRVAMALQEDGWWVRSRIVWNKPAPMPESVQDRPTSSHEYIFLLSKQKRYYYDADAIAEPTKRPGETQTFGGEKAKTAQAQNGDPRNGHRAP